MSLFSSGKKPGQGARAAIYGRFSDDKQNPLSAEDQLGLLRTECEQNGWQLVGVFKDEGKSGRTVKNRTGYLDMMAAAQAGEVDVICVHQLDRLGRNAREMTDAQYRLKDSDVVINIHGRGVMSDFEFTLYAQFAEEESNKIGERTTRGRRAAAARGRVMGDIAYGYRSVPKHDENGNPVINSRGNPVKEVEINPETAKVVLRISEDFAAGLSPYQIAETLTAEGVGTPQGSPYWQPNTIVGTKRSMCGILRNPIYVGKLIHGKTTNKRDPRTGEPVKRKNDKSNMISVDRPDLQIVPQDIWDTNQERLAARPESKLVNRKRPTYPLTGLVKCGVCGGNYVQVSLTMGCSAYKHKACSNNRRVKRELLEEAVLVGLRERLLQPDVMSWMIPEYIKERGPAIDDALERRRSADERLKEISADIDSIRKQFSLDPGQHARKLLNEDLDRLGADQERYQRELSRPATPVQQEITPEFVAERLKQLLHDLGSALKGADREAARAKELLRKLITEVTVVPFDGHDGRPDAKSGKGIRVFIKGEVSRLVDSATLEAKIMHDRGASDVHNLPVAAFSFYVDVQPEKTKEDQVHWDDADTIAMLLDDADRPLLFQELIDAMNDRGREPSDAERAADEDRARIALGRFKRTKWVRAVRIGKTHGWVWSPRRITDDEWRERYENRERPIQPIGVVRVTPPEATVIQLSPAATDKRTHRDE